MSKKNVASAKKDEIVNINLSKFASKLENKGNSHIRNERETIYIYPASIPKDRINEKEGKQFRGKMRNELKRFCNNIFYESKRNEIANVKVIIAKFDSFYKEFYRINDYSLKSLSSSNDEGKNQDIQLLLDILSEFKIGGKIEIPKRAKRAKKEKIVIEEKKAEETI